MLYFDFEVHSLLLVASVASNVSTTPAKVDPGLNSTERFSSFVCVQPICFTHIIIDTVC